MNRLFGFFKEKLIEAKQENQSELQTIMNAFEGESYSDVKMLNYLQQIKTNYLEWNIMIANQASTGLYYTQVHNKTSCLKQVKNMKESEERQQKYSIVLEQMKKTLVELQQLEKLNGKWANSMNSKVQQLQTIMKQSAEGEKRQEIKNHPHNDITDSISQTKNNAQLSMAPQFPLQFKQIEKQQQNKTLQFIKQTAIEQQEMIL